MEKKKLLVLLAVIFMQVTVVQAQEDYQKKMDNIFEIPASKIPSGILIDRSPVVLDMNGYNPANKEQVDTCSLYKWMCIYYRLYASHLKLQDFQYDKTIAQQYLSPIKQKTGKIPLGILFYDYDKLKANAMKDRLLSVDTVNMKVRDISGARGILTETATCFAVSPMVDTIPAGDYSFYIDPSLFVSNKTKELDELYIDFDDKQGYVRVSIGETINVSYSSSGNKTLKIKAVWKGESLTAYAGLYVLENKNVIMRATASTDMPEPDEGPTPYDINNGITAYYGIWYRCNHDGTIRKPILLASGFDPSNQMRIGSEQANEDVDKVSLYNVANKNGFLDELREMGYDIIAYRSANSTKSIIPNAMNLVNFITNKINAVKTSDNELIVLGASMGGVVCRYALTYMEQTNNTYNHKTKLFISMDSPQNGANVPLGFQYMVYYLDKNFDGNVEMLNKSKQDALDSDAAKEMILYHYSNTSGLTARCATNRNTFLSSLAGIGNFPKKCTTMAITMGSGNGTNQGFSAGATLIKKNSSPIVTGTYMTLDFLLTLVGIPPIIGVTLNNSAWEFEVRAVPNQTKGEIYREEIYLKICVPKVELQFPWWNSFLPTPVVTLDCSPNIIDRKIEVNNTQSLDNAPGSIKGWHNLSDFSLDGLGDIFNDLGITNINSKYDCFIPAYSALGLNVAPLTNIKSYLNTCSGVTQINNNFYSNTNKTVSPFDYLYIENANIDHIYDKNKVGVFSPAMLAAIDNLISTHQLSLDNKTITSGQSVAYEAVNVTATNVTVEPGGSLDITANSIVLKPGFHVKAGSTGHLKADNSWICPAGSIQSVSFSPLSSLDFEEVTETEFRAAKFSEKQATRQIAQELENEIRIFPNPVENILNLQILNQIEGEIKIKVIDTKGQIVHSQSVMNNVDNAIDCSQFISGVYIVNIAFKDNIRTFKIIKK